MRMRTASAAKCIVFGGLTAGAFDITYAMIAAASKGRPITRPVQAVASGLLGAAAFDEGMAGFLSGLALHFLIACAAAAIYFLASTRIALLRERVLLPGAIFGILVYLFMNFIVLPLSAVPFELTYPPRALFIGFVVHIFLVGLPIGHFVRRGWSDSEHFHTDVWPVTQST
jgi:hypothetical protein